MIDTYCIYHISYLTTQKKPTQNRFGVFNSYWRIKTKLKAISNDFSPDAALTRPWKFRQNSKTKYLFYTGKINISFKKVAVSEPAVLLKVIFNSGSFPHFYKTL